MVTPKRTPLRRKHLKDAWFAGGWFGAGMAILVLGAMTAAFGPPPDDWTIGPVGVLVAGASVWVLRRQLGRSPLMLRDLCDIYGHAVEDDGECWRCGKVKQGEDLTLRLGDVLVMPDGAWRVGRFCDEPDTGMVVMESVEPRRGINVVVPVAWVAAEKRRRQDMLALHRLDEAANKVMFDEPGDDWIPVNGAAMVELDAAIERRDDKGASDAC